MRIDLACSESGCIQVVFVSTELSCTSFSLELLGKAWHDRMWRSVTSRSTWSFLFTELCSSGFGDLVSISRASQLLKSVPSIEMSISATEMAS